MQCKQVSEWTNNGDKTSKCTKCGLQGTNTKQRCKECHEQHYLYLGEFNKRCAECSSGYGPKGVSDIMLLPCLFCEDTVQTWYIYQDKGKMRCTNCHALRPILAPLIPEQCPTCFRLFDAGLQTFSDISRCDECFRTQLAKYNTSGPKPTEGEPKKAGNTTYIYHCEFCQSNQVWVNYG